MSLARAIGRNTLLQFGGKVVGTVLGLLTVGLLQRYLNPSGFGSYTIAMAYLGFLSVLADLGLYLMLIRELAKPGADEQRVVGNILGLRWVSAAVILGFGTILVFALPYSGEVKEAVTIGVVSFAAIAATQLLVGIFQTKLQMGRVVAAEVIGRAVLLGATVWAVTSDAGLRGAITAVVAGSLTNFFIVWLAANRVIPLRVRFEWGYWRSILRDTWPIALSIVLNLIYFRIGIIFLSFFSSEYNVGLYGAAYKILEILNTFPIMFVGLLLPTLGRAFAAGDNQRFQNIYQRGFELLCMAALPILVGGWILAEKILIAIGDAEFAPAASTLQLLLIAVTALFLNALSGHVITVINRQRQMVWTYLSVAILGVAAYLYLIPRYELHGAAIGTIITETATAVVGFIVVLRVMRFRLKAGTILRIILAAGVMGGFLWLVREWNTWLVLVLGAGVYGLVLLATKTLTMATLREVFSNRSDAPPDVLNP